MKRKLSQSILLSLLLLLLLLPMAAYGEDANSLFARFKAVSGGAHWDAIHSLQSFGTVSAGGLNGEFHETQDLLTGRYHFTYKAGPVEGAQGYNGSHAWKRAPGGEVAVLDAPEAVRRARSKAWLDARGYWYPQRIAASYGKVESRELEGKEYRVVEATPNGGDPVTLWFESGSGLLTRTAQHEGSEIVTTLLDDYRSVDGVLLPFHISTDRTDAAGRTDSRQRVEIHLDRIDTNVALSSNEFAMPAMVATARIDDASGVTHIPFDLVNNHIYVDGAVNGKPARFMVDTGGQNLLTPKAAKKFGLKSEGKLAAGGVGKQRPDLAFASAKEVRIGTAILAKPVFIVVDLGDLPKVEGVGFDGLVGYEMFRRFGVQIDYAKKLLTLCEPAKFVPPADATGLPFDLDDQMPIISGMLDSIPVRLTVDTGSRDSLTLSAPFVRAHDLVAKYKAAPESVIGWGVGGAVRGRPARLGTLRLGDLDINGIAGTLFTGTKGGFTNPNQAGNIGGSVLRRFTVAFDYASKKLYLAPNGDFGKPYAFDQSGLWLLADGEALKIAAIAKGTGAERAGLHENDRIQAINGAAISAKSLSEWREQLRKSPAGTQLAIKFERNGESRKTVLTLANRIPDASK